MMAVRKKILSGIGNISTIGLEKQFIYVRRHKYNKSEETCKWLLERVFIGHKFEKARPRWLVNSETGRTMELDLYNEDLGVALEYNGIQHYCFNKWFHKNVDMFERQLLHDAEKRRICNERKVILVVVPNIRSFNSIRAFLRDELGLISSQ